MIVDYNDLEVCQIELTTECGAGCPQCPRNVYGGKTVDDLPICELSLDDIKLTNKLNYELLDSACDELLNGTSLAHQASLLYLYGAPFATGWHEKSFIYEKKK